MEGVASAEKGAAYVYAAGQRTEDSAEVPVGLNGGRARVGGGDRG